MTTTPHNAGPLSGCILANAEDVKVGDEVCFKMPSANYVVREVGGGNGVVRHYFGEEASSNAYRPGERLYVRRAAPDLAQIQKAVENFERLKEQQMRECMGNVENYDAEGVESVIDYHLRSFGENHIGTRVARAIKAERIKAALVEFLAAKVERAEARANGQPTGDTLALLKAICARYGAKWEDVAEANYQHQNQKELPRFHVVFGRALRVVAEFPDSEDGTVQAM